MTSVRAARIAASLLFLFAPAASPFPRPAAADVTAAARAFLATLSPKLRGQALLSAADPERKGWSYVPGGRRGARLKDMTAAERAAALALLRASSSARGYEKAVGVIELEGILRELETFGWSRDPELYWVTVFGPPGADAVWGWRLEGHHLSLSTSPPRGRGVRLDPRLFRRESGARSGRTAVGLAGSSLRRRTSRAGSWRR